MNVKKIEEVIRLMETYNLAEISVEEEGVKVHLKKNASGAIQEAPKTAVPHIILPEKQAAAEPPKADKNVIEVKAPMVGTFYRAPSPDAKPFADIGAKIKEGDVLCIIEAMKLMNEIKSEVKGKIVDILVENGNPVEFGQVLFLVEPA